MKYCREGNQQFETLQGKWDIKLEHCREERHKTKLHKKLLIKVCVSVLVCLLLSPPPLVGLWVKPTLTVTTTRQLSPLPCLHVKLSLRGIPCAPPCRL
jgi:hypothetical protein